MCVMRRLRWRRSTGVALMLMVGLFAACGGDTPAPVADAQLELGRSVYNTHCASCHGTKGQGVVGPKIGSGAVVDKFPDAAAERSVVEDGRKAMPKFSSVLSSEEIDAVVRYTRELLGS
jgi:mono/diheme cytochrome c family protein